MTEFKSNFEYTTYKDIYNRLKSQIRGKTIQELDVAQWCSECEVEQIGDVERFVEVLKEPITVTDYKALIPCNAFRILDVLDGGGNQINPQRNGAYVLLPSNYGYTSIYLSYHAIATDPDTGYPLIKKGHEEACLAYCIYKAYYEDYLTKAIDGQQWNFIVQEKEGKIQATKYTAIRNMTIRDKERINRAHARMFERIGDHTSYHERYAR